MKQNKQGFTLVELLVVVLIIGILSAIAIPMYQGAVDKSHWSTMLPASKAIKDAEEAFKMTNGEYSDTMEHLDVQISNSDLQFDLQTPNNLSQPNVIRVTNSKLDGVRLASYLDDSPMFAGQLHCEANDGPEGRGTRLCEKLLGGQYIMPVDNGYTAYLLDQEIDEGTCKHAEQSWSTSKTKCYKDHESRCDALDSGYLGNGQCGYQDTQNEAIGEEEACIGDNGGGCNGTTVNSGGICIGNTSNSCQRSTINDGGTCLATEAGHHGACANSTINSGGICIAESQDGCSSSTFNEGSTCWARNGEHAEGNYMCKSSTFNGSKCIDDHSGYGCVLSVFNAGSVCQANAGGASCSWNTLNDGAVCEANVANSCLYNTYTGSGCCRGAYCPTDAPKCSN